MKVLITGGAGCLGSNLVEHWLPLGHEILVIDNFITGKKSVLLGNIDRLTVVEGSIEDNTLLEKCFREFEPSHVVHSAASYKDPNDWLADVNTNVNGTINVIRNCEKYAVERLVNFQTALCYGRPSSVPIKVDSKTEPFTSYGISKLAGEAFILSSSVSAISLRLANICGPRLAIGPIPTFYQRLKDGKDCFCSDSVRDFLDMSDFLSLMDIVINKNDEVGAYNVSTGKGNTIKDIFEVVRQYLNLPEIAVPIVPVGEDDVPAVVLDPSKTEEVFGWQAEMPFLKIIQKQLAWYEQHGISDIYSHLSDPTKN